MTTVSKSAHDFVSPLVRDLPKSGIRDFFDIVLVPRQVPPGHHLNDLLSRQHRLTLQFHFINQLAHFPRRINLFHGRF